MERAELAFIPIPGAGHLVPMVELAKALTTRDERISVTVFIMEVPFQSKLNSYTQSLLSNPPPSRVRFVHLTLDEPTTEDIRSKPGSFWLLDLIQINKSRVKDFYSSDSTRYELAAFVVDMFCSQFAEVASEFGVPDYVFFTSNAYFLSLMFYLQAIQDYQNRDIAEFKDSDVELSIPGFMNPVPTKVLPHVAFDKEKGGALFFVDVPRKLRKTKGILANTFEEFESYTIKCLAEDDKVPPIYTIGPVLNLKAETSNDQKDLVQYEEIMAWLDCQPSTSVVFLCFGSMGTFEAEQVVEIATALEHSGHRFLWSLRRPPPEGKKEPPSDYENLSDVLPEGFLDRTKEVGKVIGWAPQTAVLSHPAVGGFISHCGWNSIMESLWFGVPIATWPLYAEQQINAFEMVKELQLAVEISLDYKKENHAILTAEEIERGIKQLMDGNESVEIKKKVKAMSEKSRSAVEEGGSSYAAVGRFIEEVLNRSS
uniref:Glycosyltransferase n=1 Tax=Cyclamen persicum TaxID=87530 RepID=A7M6J7_9ERIC|nr:tetrahydroxychalcone 2'-glucosyltransferase [Cyclamen persicum]